MAYVYDILLVERFPKLTDDLDEDRARSIKNHAMRRCFKNWHDDADEQLLPLSRHHEPVIFGAGSRSITADGSWELCYSHGDAYIRSDEELTLPGMVLRTYQLRCSFTAVENTATVRPMILRDSYETEEEAKVALEGVPLRRLVEQAKTQAPRARITTLEVCIVIFPGGDEKLSRHGDQRSATPNDGLDV